MSVEFRRYLPLVPPASTRYVLTLIVQVWLFFGLVAVFWTATEKLLALYPIGVLFEDRIVSETLSAKSTRTAK